MFVAWQDPVERGLARKMLKIFLVGLSRLTKMYKFFHKMCNNEQISLHCQTKIKKFPRRDTTARKNKVFKPEEFSHPPTRPNFSRQRLSREENGKRQLCPFHGNPNFRWRDWAEELLTTTEILPFFSGNVSAHPNISSYPKNRRFYVQQFLALREIQECYRVTLAGAMASKKELSVTT